MLAITDATTSTTAVILRFQKGRSDTGKEDQRKRKLLLSKMILKGFKKRGFMWDIKRQMWFLKKKLINNVEYQRKRFVKESKT